MATQVQLQLLASLAGGAATHGYQQAAFGQSCQLSLQSTAGLFSVRYEIYDYPPGFSCPAGWSTDTTGVYSYAPSNVTSLPPSFNLPSSGNNNWGWFMCRVRGNQNPLQRNADLSPNTAYNPLLTDEATALVIPSPNSGALGVAYNLSNQYAPDPLRLGGVGALMQTLRALDSAVSSATLGTPATKTATYGMQPTDGALTFNIAGGAATCTVPAAPIPGRPYPIRVGTAGGTLTVQGNGNTIDGGANLKLTGALASAILIYDATSNDFGVY